MTANITAANTFADGLHNIEARRYATHLIDYYRHYGTPLAVGAPCTMALNSATERRVHNTIRHYMVGDCDCKGFAIDRTGRRI